MTDASLSSLSSLLSTAAGYSVSATGAGTGAGAGTGGMALAMASPGAGAAAALEGGKRFWGTLVKTVSAAAVGNVPPESSGTVRADLSGAGSSVEAGPGWRSASGSEVGLREAKKQAPPPANLRRLSVQMQRPPLPRQLSLESGSTGSSTGRSATGRGQVDATAGANAGDWNSNQAVIATGTAGADGSRQRGDEQQDGKDSEGDSTSDDEDGWGW